MIDYETEYRTRVNNDDFCIEIVRWCGEDTVIFSQPYQNDNPNNPNKTAFDFKSARKLTNNLLNNLLTINPWEKVYEVQSSGARKTKV